MNTRNKPCLCGSGKKHKKCCLPIAHKEIKRMKAKAYRRKVYVHLARFFRRRKEPMPFRLRNIEDGVAWYKLQIAMNSPYIQLKKIFEQT